MGRIIPVSSGKGGVGKTTFAINFALALSRVAPTVLIDLDTGTSSVRNTLAVPVGNDLYHFHRKGASLRDCITRLDDKLDPHGLYSDFGFVAGPKHFIDDMAHPDEAFRRRTADEINRLPAEFVVVDLRAGLDYQVLDFLPYTNTGVLIVAPHHPAATLAASDIVKAIVFRSLRILFARDSRFFLESGLSHYHGLIHDLLDKVEDVYEESIPHLDAFLVELKEAFGDHPILGVIAENLSSFRVCYVLNMFDGVEESYEEALVPFVRNLAENVSARLNLTQLGWIVFDERINESNASGIPILLQETPKKKKARSVDLVLEELEELEEAMLGIRRTKRKRVEIKRHDHHFDLAAANDLLAGELKTLNAMFASRSEDRVKENFAYITFRARNLMAPPMASSEFGQTKLKSPEQLLDWFLLWQRAHSKELGKVTPTAGPAPAASRTEASPAPPLYGSPRPPATATSAARPAPVAGPAPAVPAAAVPATAVPATAAPAAAVPASAVPTRAFPASAVPTSAVPTPAAPAVPPGLRASQARPPQAAPAPAPSQASPASFPRPTLPPAVPSLAAAPASAASPPAPPTSLPAADSRAVSPTPGAAASEESPRTDVSYPTSFEDEEL